MQALLINLQKIARYYLILTIREGIRWDMTNIREVLAANLKKYRQARGWSQAKLAEKTGTSTQYIGMLEIKGKFPSSDMIHKLAMTLGIDPTELFYKDIDPQTTMKNAQKAVIEDIGEAVNRLVTDFFSEKVQKLDEETGKDGN
jgi:transcriptional regulator with XRE-family HTH domain